MPDSHERHFRKSPKQPQAALAEAAGLRWLGEASGAVVRVVEADETSITTERVSPKRPTPDAARQAGRELASIHLAGATSFGAPPAPGGKTWDGLNYIGRQTQPCEPSDSWGEFYATQRVLPFLRAAVDCGHVDESGARIVAKACEVIADASWDVAPARIHGDLWAGNLLFGREGPAFIDPAAHGGHPETDLAMLALFGAPFLDEIRSGYQEVRPLEPDWLDYTEMHQLHPLAVHAVSHGPSYGDALIDAARRTLAVLR